SCKVRLGPLYRLVHLSHYGQRGSFVLAGGRRCHDDRGKTHWGCTTMMKDLSLSKVYQLLEPGPVVLLTTARKGRANIMTLSWHMMVEFEAPLIACVVSNRNYSFAALRATKECVIAVPSWESAIARGGMWISSRDSA